MQFAYCSAKGCAHSQIYGACPIKKSRRAVPMEKLCTECGAEMIGKCPGCGAYRESMEKDACPVCGKPYK